jgi:DNA-binding NtrC family response regulator
MSIFTLPLRAATKLLGAITPNSAPPTPKPAAPRPPAPTAASASTTASARGQRGKYDQQLTEVVAARPGITVAQAAQRIGVHPTALYPVIKRLETHGRLVKRGRELHPSH